MSIIELRQKAHLLIENATEDRLQAVLETLESTSIYSNNDLKAFKNQSELYQQGKLETFSFEEIKAMIINKQSTNNVS